VGAAAGGADASRGPDAHNTCAVVVTYFPDSGFEQRLQNMEAQFARVVVVDNASTGSSATRLEALMSAPGRHWIRNPDNAGIAQALNQGLAFADAQGCQWAVTFDQDSEISADLLATLASVWRSAPGENNIFGVNYWNRHHERFRVNGKPGQVALVRKTVITSGMMLPLALVKSIGGFREDYFIDSVDHEFCLRARAHGGQVFITCRSLMVHGFGETSRRRGFRFAAIDHYGPVRKYYTARNMLVTAMNFWRREPLWVLRQFARLSVDAAGIIFFESGKSKKLAAFRRGIADALSGKMGPLAGPQTKPDACDD